MLIRRGLFLALLALLPALAPAVAAPLRIGYSDWPGWVAWQVAIDKGWLKDAGVDAEFQWFDYSQSMDAFGAGKIDADCVSNGDSLVMSGGGNRNLMVMLTDFSNGNDMIVGRPGVKSIKDLKGKKVAVEVGLVEHLLLLDGLQKAGLSEADVTLVNTKTNDTPQVLASGEVAAIGAWQPVSGQAMKALPGSRPIHTSANTPGLIYDVLVVSPESFKARKAEWKKLTLVWDKVVHYINDPKTQDDAVKIMAARVGLEPAAYKALLAGTHLIDLAEGKALFTKAAGFGSLYGSSEIANDFNFKNAVYKQKLDVAGLIDASLMEGK
jgi:NitT/TauT family transport system substrate-binding protein